MYIGTVKLFKKLSSEIDLICHHAYYYHHYFPVENLLLMLRHNYCRSGTVNLDITIAGQGLLI
jgi:hypothetical protein